jgi:hypothetical protein
MAQRCADDAPLAVHTVSTCDLHVSATCWRSPASETGAQTAQSCVQLRVQPLKPPPPTPPSQPQPASTKAPVHTAVQPDTTVGAIDCSATSDAAPGADGATARRACKRARLSHDRVIPSQDADVAAALGSEGARDARSADVGTAAAGVTERGAAAAQQAHACVTMQAESVQHAATLGEWLVVCRRSGVLVVWKLACAAAATPDSASAGAAGGNTCGPERVAGEGRDEGMGQGQDGECAQQVHEVATAAVEWQQVAGWQLEGVDVVEHMQVEPVPSACGTGDSLHALLLLPGGRALYVLTPLPV